MTNNNHPITPPLELLKYWEDQHFDEGENYDVMLIQAYQAGGDQELEACCAWLDMGCYQCSVALRAHRRSKPPSLKEQALEQLKRVDSDLRQHGIINTDFIRRALEQLDD